MVGKKQYYMHSNSTTRNYVMLDCLKKCWTSFNCNEKVIEIMPQVIKPFLLLSLLFSFDKMYTYMYYTICFVQLTVKIQKFPIDRRKEKLTALKSTLGFKVPALWKSAIVSWPSCNILVKLKSLKVDALSFVIFTKTPNWFYSKFQNR